MDEESAKAKPTAKQFEFIPKLRGKKVVIRLLAGGQPITILQAGSPMALALGGMPYTSYCNLYIT